MTLRSLGARGIQRLRLPSEDHPQERVFAITVWLGLAFSCLGAVASLAAGLYLLTAVDVVGALVATWCLRRLERQQATARVFLWTFLITLPASALATTPMDPTILFYLFVLPLLAANLFGPATTRQWFVRIMIAGALVFVLAGLGLTGPEHDAPSLGKPISSLLGAMAASMALFTTMARQSALATQRLQEAERAKSAFFANLGHELRTPMNGVIGMTDALLLQALPPTELEMVQTIRSSGALMMGLLDDLLDLSKLEANRLLLHEAPLALQTLETELRVLWQPLAHAKGLSLELRRAPDLPAHLLLDGRRLRQILGNLISNAIKFTDQGSVTVALDAAGDRLRCRVEDTGIGISPEHQQRLFHRFVQLDEDHARAHQGAGLGLALSRQLSQLMGGSLELASTAGAGSCFTCTLPLRPVEAPLPPPSEARQLPPGLTVLVVDDNAVNRLVAQRLLERCGCLVELAVDGLCALERLAGPARFDAVLMDVQMPGLDGLETTRRLRARHLGPLRIIGVSASAESTDVQRCLEAGMDGFLAKPLTRDRLVEILLQHPPPSPEPRSPDRPAATETPAR